MSDKKIEIVHIAKEVIDPPNHHKMIKPKVYPHRKVKLLCGALYSELDYVENSWATVEEFFDEPLMEDENSREVLCEDCKNHPDFVIRYLGNV